VGVDLQDLVKLQSDVGVDLQSDVAVDWQDLVKLQSDVGVHCRIW